MQIVALGINHKTADLQTREKLAFTGKQTERAYFYLRSLPGIKECVIITTCNRTEVYAHTVDAEAAREYLISMFGAVKGVNFNELEKAIYFYCGSEAVLHLFRVTAGLDSMILGETQILGQIKEAYEKAVENCSVGKVLHGLFQQVISCAKKVQTQTRINHNSLSVSYLAVEMIRKELGCLKNLTVLVIGAGKMSRLTLKHLHEFGVKEVRVTSRTYQRAKDLAHLFSGETIDFKKKKEMLADIDIIISSTGAPHYILHREDLEPVMEKRHYKPVFIIDIAVPRDIDPEIRNLRNVYLYDMDSLQQVVAVNHESRQHEAQAAGNIIACAVDGFLAWFKTLEVSPLIEALRLKAEKVRQEETEKYLNGKLCGLGEKEKLAVENLTRSLVNSLLREPILKVKGSSLTESQKSYVETLSYLFDLENEWFLRGVKHS